MANLDQISLFGKVVIHPGTIIMYLDAESIFVATVSRIVVEEGREFYESKCSCGKCKIKKIAIENVIEAFDTDDIFNNEPLINQAGFTYLH